MERIDDLKFSKDAAAVSALPAGGDLAAAIAERLQEARQLSAELPLDAAAPADPTANVEPLVERLGVIRTLIERDQPFRVYYTAHGGFDTHAGQRGTHQNLWRQVSEAVSGFLADLKKEKLSQGVTVFLFSEFGRRVRENGSQGTDHGAAAPVFLLGENVKGGLAGGPPNLADLDDGDLKMQIDFRDVYAALLRDGLGIDPTPALGEREGKLKLFG